MPAVLTLLHTATAAACCMPTFSPRPRHHATQAAAQVRRPSKGYSSSSAAAAVRIPPSGRERVLIFHYSQAVAGLGWAGRVENIKWAMKQGMLARLIAGRHCQQSLTFPRLIVIAHRGIKYRVSIWISATEKNTLTGIFWFDVWKRWILAWDVHTWTQIVLYNPE